MGVLIANSLHVRIGSVNVLLRRRGIHLRLLLELLLLLVWLLLVLLLGYLVVHGLLGVGLGSRLADQRLLVLLLLLRCSRVPSAVVSLLARTTRVVLGNNHSAHSG